MVRCHFPRTTPVCQKREKLYFCTHVLWGQQTTPFYSKIGRHKEVGFFANQLTYNLLETFPRRRILIMELGVCWFYCWSTKDGLTAMLVRFFMHSRLTMKGEKNSHLHLDNSKLFANFAFCFCENNLNWTTEHDQGLFIIRPGISELPG
jgi:hypothetical protein